MSWRWAICGDKHPCLLLAESGRLYEHIWNGVGQFDTSRVNTLLFAAGFACQSQTHSLRSSWLLGKWCFHLCCCLFQRQSFRPYQTLHEEENSKSEHLTVSAPFNPFVHMTRYSCSIQLRPDRVTRIGYIQYDSRKVSPLHGSKRVPYSRKPKYHHRRCTPLDGCLSPKCGRCSCLELGGWVPLHLQLRVSYALLWNRSCRCLLQSSDKRLPR